MVLILMNFSARLKSQLTVSVPPRCTTYLQTLFFSAQIANNQVVYMMKDVCFSGYFLLLWKHGSGLLFSSDVINGIK